MGIARWIALSLAAVLIAFPAAAQEWAERVQREISAKQSYPRSAVLRGQEGTALLRVKVLPSGKIADIDLVEKTGSEILDREALRIPARVKTLSPPPDGGTHMVEVAIRFRLEGG